MDEQELAWRQVASDLRSRAELDVLMSAYKRKIRREAAEGRVNRRMATMMDQLGLDCEDVKGETRGRKKDTRRWHVTISAKDSVDFHGFLRQMAKCVKKKVLAGTGVYSLEQRAEGDQEPYGWHIHWRVEFETLSAKKTIIQQVAQCFVSYIAADNYIDARPIYTDEHWDTVGCYLDGTKTEAKLEKVEKDRALRAKYGIPDKISH